MNTKTVEQFEALDTELLASVNGGQALKQLEGGSGGRPYYYTDPKDVLPNPIRRW